MTCSDALGGAYEQWDGRGWPGKLSGEEVPLPARISQLAEFTEVAFRVGGVPGRTGAGAQRAPASSSTPQLANVMATEAPRRSSPASTPSRRGMR